MAARSKWVLGTAVAAIVILPAGFVVASLEKEKETSRQFLENLPEALKETQTRPKKNRS
jgi:integral membrane sensor domain MASE1